MCILALLLHQESACMNAAVVYVTGPMKINHLSANYTKLYFC